MKIFIILIVSICTASVFAKELSMKVAVISNGNTTIFKLNNSDASKELYEQLPLQVKVENYSTNEKIFYPPNKLVTVSTPKANAKNGTLVYYAPWGNVLMFYKDFGSASGLYELGFVESGKEYIKTLSGIIEIHKVEN